VEEAAELARAFGYELALLHVAESAHANLGTGQESLEQTCQRLREHGLRVRHLQACGVPSEVILKVARDPAVKYVVLGTQGPVGIQRWTLGSVAAQILRKANVPVVTVRTAL
jgi:nucleotide-binding universal stress UspA family protein